MMLYKMKNLMIALVLSVSVMGLLGTSMANASGGEDTQMFNVDINVFDKAALQRGARTFTSYCLGCHSASYMRFKRLAQDLDYSEDEIKQYLLPPGRELIDTMSSAMSAENAEQLFGTKVPDLSLAARARGDRWLYSYFLSFYADEERKLGWNNTVFPNASMPNVLWELQGVQALKHDNHDDGHADEGHEVEEGHGGHPDPAEQFELLQAGLESPNEYRRTVQDLVTFLVYLSEPSQLQRHKLGLWVMLFLALFAFFAWMLKTEYWRDIH